MSATINRAKPKGELKRGWTTGACAAAAAGAAYNALESGVFPDKAGVRLPGGQTPVFDLATFELGQDYAQVGIIKDAGDDPDVTHGLEIIARVERGANKSGISFCAGDGVGTVTLPGLPLAVGEPAINSGPRAMIEDAIMAVALGFGHEQKTPDVIVSISVPGGIEAAEKTMNQRLGIVGGISILGTSGIVIPYSCASWIHAIRSGIDVADELKIKHLLAATGRTSEKAANKILELPEQALIDMGDFAGGMLKYLTTKQIPRLTIAGGFGKIVKLSQGEMDLHSSRSSVDIIALALILGGCGATPKQIEVAKKSQTAAQVLKISESYGPALAHLIAKRAREVAMATISGGTEIDVWIFNREGKRIGISDSP
ncbi:MAG: cobalt-precorrin-5B (C(1))-methyltransferase [Rhodospirillaceae bacterium]|nr:cobalt-precorrin-5B (C(1))-methyltransferase [Rhodospirillaceae bacterium]